MSLTLHIIFIEETCYTCILTYRSNLLDLYCSIKSKNIIDILMPGKPRKAPIMPEITASASLKIHIGADPPLLKTIKTKCKNINASLWF